MTYTIRIIRPDGPWLVDDVQVEMPGLNASFEVGSGPEAVSILENDQLSLLRIFGGPLLFPANATIRRIAGGLQAPVGDPPSQATAPEGDSTTAPASATAEAPRRGRKPKNQPDPSTASAPPPAPVPDAPAAPPPAPALATASAPPAPSVDGLALPAFLDRSNPGNVATGDGSAAPVAAPPPMPAAPPIAPPAPAVPPVGVLGAKMVDAITKQKQGDGSVWVKWLADSGLVVPGATFDEAMDCLRLTADGKLAAAAAQLQIA